MLRRVRSLEDCLSADAGFARLSGHARLLLRLQRNFESATPLARQARVANLRLGRIVIHARNGAIATKLKHMAPKLVDAFRHETGEVTGIDIRVQPGPANLPTISRESPATIAPPQKQALTSLANRLPSGSPLAQALQRLLTRAR